MTKQEAIDILVGVIATNSEEENEALDMAIEALEVGHAQCDDCHYRYHWLTQRMNGSNGGATA